MSPQLQNVTEVINEVRRRIRTRQALRGAAITLAVAAATLLIVAMAAGVLKQSPAALIVLRIVPVVTALAAAWLFLIRPLRANINDSKVARLIEEKCALSDRLVTAVEYSEDPREASPAIVDRLVSDAARRSASADIDRVVDPRQAYAYGAAAAVILLGLIGTLVLAPRSVYSGLTALYASDDDSVSASSMLINVSPGTARVPRGSDQKLKASLAGFDSPEAQIFIRKVGSDGWQAQSMEPAKNKDEFQFVIFNIQDSVSYYVEAKGVRSPEFSLEVVDLPFVKQIDLVLNFPSYTRLPSKKVENGGEVAALKGTVVEVSATLSGNAKAARIVISDGTRVEMSWTDDGHFVGQFTVKQNGTYRIELTSESGERYNGSNEYDITLLEDHAPTVLIDKPGRDMKVSSIQEVFTQVRAEDDFGVTSVELYYSVNGGEEKKVSLQDLKSDAAHTLTGAHTFFLEEYGLQPGDFISYYAKARDNSANESTSDIYFMEVRPFDREFRQSPQQGGQGQGSDQESNALTRRQREIIAATFRVQRELSTYTPPEKDENFGAVTLSQEKLKTDAENLAERIRRRLGDQLNSQPDYAKLVEHVVQASKEMSGAIDELRAKKTKEALPPEQRALQQLLRAEAIFRDIQVSRGGGQGQGNNQEQQELADLFELQLDKMKNQYETVQRQQQESQNQQQDEIARRLAELARRQQQQLEQRMRSQMSQQGGGGGGSQRQQQEMIDEAQKMARELEKLSRDRRDQKLAEAAQQMQQAAEELKRAQASQSQSSSQQGNGEATAQQLRAVDRMEQARRMLESAQRANGQQSAQKLRQQAEDALKRQEEISKSVEELARNPQAGNGAEQKKQQISDRKQALAEQVAGLEKDIDQAARGMGQDRQQSADKLREAAGAIRQNRIPERIRQNQELISHGYYDQAKDRERTIKGNLEEVLKDLQAAEGGGKNSPQGQGLEEALNRARELTENLESLRRKLESGQSQEQGQQGQQGQQSQGQQAGRQGQQGQQNQQGQSQGQQAGRQGQQSQQSQGQQAGRQGQQGQQSQGQQAGRQGQQGQRSQQAGRQGQQGQQGQQAGRQGQQGQQGQQAGQQGQQGQSGQQGQGGQQAQGQGAQGSQEGGRPTSASAEDPRTTGGGPPTGGARQLESEIRQRLADAEELKRALGKNPELTKDLNRAIEQLRRINPNAFADPAQLALLKNEVIDPLRALEIELARRLQAKLGNNGPGAFGDGDAPDRYRKTIEDYYRRLSARSPDAKP